MPNQLSVMIVSLDITPPGSEPPCQWQRRKKPQDITMHLGQTQNDVVLCYRKGGSES